MWMAVILYLKTIRQITVTLFFQQVLIKMITKMIITALYKTATLL